MDSIPKRREWMPAYAIAIQVVTTVLLGIRLISRFKKLGGGLGLDDMFVVMGWGFSVALTVSVCYMTIDLEFDRSIHEIPSPLWKAGSLWGWITEIFVLLGGLCVKLSVLLFYRRLVDGTASSRFKAAIWAAMAFVTIYTVTFIILLLIGCRPFAANLWQYDVLWMAEHAGEVKCWSRKIAFDLATLCGVFSVFTDFYSVMLPAVLLLRIRMNPRQKYGLMFIFGLGFTVVGAGIARTYYLGKVQVELDKYWYAFNVEAASLAEINIAIICACAPSLKHVTGVFFRNIKNLSSKGSRDQSSYDSRPKIAQKLPMDESWDSKTDAGAPSSKSTNSFLPRAFSSRLKSHRFGGGNGFGGKDLSSFAEAHEYGFDGVAPVAEGYDEEEQPHSFFRPASFHEQLHSIDEVEQYSIHKTHFRPSAPSRY